MLPWDLPFKFQISGCHSIPRPLCLLTQTIHHISPGALGRTHKNAPGRSFPPVASEKQLQNANPMRTGRDWLCSHPSIYSHSWYLVGAQYTAVEFTMSKINVSIYFNCYPSARYTMENLLCLKSFIKNADEGEIFKNFMEMYTTKTLQKWPPPPPGADGKERPTPFFPEDTGGKK